MRGSSPYTGRVGGFLAAATYCTGVRGWPAPRQGASRKHGFPRLAPTLWNLFYEDAWRAIHEAGFVEIVNADDSNGFREFEHNASADSIIAEAKKCQSELHNVVERTRSRLTPRRSACTSCPTPSRTVTV